jgi:hypothetical protein
MSTREGMYTGQREGGKANEPPMRLGMLHVDRLRCAHLRGSPILSSIFSSQPHLLSAGYPH